MVRFLDESVLPVLGRRGAVEAMRRFLLAAAAGRADGPPRVTTEAGGRQHVFTVGADRDSDIAGFRYYSIGPRREGSGPTQIVTLTRAGTGEVLAVAAGDAFGAWRTAALGAVAMAEGLRHLDRPVRVGVLGAGFQAGHHTRTWAETVAVERFAVWARRPEAALAFSRRLAADTGVPVVACEGAADACAGADAVLAVTASPTPVVEDGALPRTGYVATVGPKFGGRHELPAETYARAALLVTDAPEQARRFEADRGRLPGGRRASEMAPLADLVAGRRRAPEDELTLFVSEGLAGSEVALVAAALAAAGG